MARRTQQEFMQSRVKGRNKTHFLLEHNLQNVEAIATWIGSKEWGGKDWSEYKNFASQRWPIFANLSLRIQGLIICAEAIKDDVKNGRVSLAQHQLVEHVTAYILDTSQVAEQFRQEIPSAYYQTLAMLSEQLYRWGDNLKARRILEEGNEILAAILTFNKTGKVEPPLSEDVTIVKEQIRFCVSYIQTSSYTDFKYEKTLEELNACQDFVNERLKYVSCIGTKAHIHSYLGRCYRNRLEHRHASKAFSLSISEYEARANTHSQSIQRDEYLVNREKKYIRHKVSLILILGYGWMDILRGRLHKGLYNSLFPAKVLLADIDDDLARAYLLLLEGTAMLGLSLPKYVKERFVEPTFSVEQAYEKIKEAASIYRKINIPRFTVRVLFQEALALEYGCRWAEAEEKADEVIRLSSSQDEAYWNIRTHLVKARILYNRQYHEKGNATLKDVLGLLERVQESSKHFRQSHLEFYYTRGETYLTWQRYEEAKRDFESARDLNRRANRRGEQEYFNPKIEAACLLRLAYMDAKLGLTSKAETWLGLWENSLAEMVDDVYLHYLGERYKRKLKRMAEGEFTIKIDSPRDLNYKVQETRLRKFLIQQATQLAEKEGDLTKAVANHMHVSKQTLITWRKEFGMTSSKNKKSS
jgi:tetratricopeptide (TPR) repeat protein